MSLLGPMVLPLSVLQLSALADRVLALVTSDTVDLYRDDGQVFFHAAGVTFMARTIAEEFPDFERVIPKDNTIALVFDRRSILETLQRTQITAAEDSGAISIRANAEDSAVLIKSSSNDKGVAEERVRLKQVPSAEIEIKFRAEYIIDALKRFSSEDITLWLSGAEKAGLIEPAGETITEADQGFLYVCMPVRLPS